MKRFTIMAMLTINAAALLASTLALAQEVEIPVIIDRSYLEESRGTLASDPRYSENRRLQSLDLAKREIALSPDGKFIAFVSGPAPFSIYNTTRDIGVVPIEGGEPVIVYSIPENQLFRATPDDVPLFLARYIGEITSIAFSPDSKSITFCREYYNYSKGSRYSERYQYNPSESGGYTYSGSHTDIYAVPTIEQVDISTGEVTTIIEEGSAPSWSADGRYLSYIHYDHRFLTNPSEALHNGAPAIYDAVTGETRFLSDESSTFSVDPDKYEIVSDIWQGIKYTSVLMTEDNSELICVATRRENFNAAVTAHLTRISIETGVESAIRDNENNYFRNLRRVPGGRYITYTGWIEDVDMRRIIILDLNSSEIVWAFLENSNGNISGEVTSEDGSIIYLSQYQFDWYSEDGKSHVGSSIATKICRQPIDIEVRFAVGNAPLPPEVPDDYGLLAQFGARLSDIEVAQGPGNSPVWSPDGKKIAFVADGGKIWEMPADGGEMVQVYDNPAIEYQGYSLHIPRTDLFGYSTDGNEILFSKETVDEARGSLPVLTVKEDRLSTWSWSNPIFYLYALNLNTGEVRTVVECGDYGVYSPDGRYLAYTVRDANLTDTFVQEHNDQIILRNLDNGIETFLPLSTHQNFKWTYDSNAILVHVSPTEYQLIPIDGSEPETVPTTATSWLYSINSQYPIIVTQDSNALYSVNYITGERTRLTPDLGCDFMNPAFSPDGSKLAYLIKYEGKSRNNPYSTGYRTELFIMDYPVPTDILPTFVEDNTTPAAELLIANYPNPFNPMTTISFSLPSEGVARLDIFNLSGQKVRELVHGNLAAGMHEVVWDSRNDSGMPLASGMYIARITIGSHMATQRMLLMK